MVTHLQVANAGADGFDHPGGLVAPAEGQMRYGDVTSREVIIGVAEARRHHSNKYLVVARLIELESFRRTICRVPRGVVPPWSSHGLLLTGTLFNREISAAAYICEIISVK